MLISTRPKYSRTISASLPYRCLASKAAAAPSNKYRYYFGMSLLATVKSTNIGCKSSVCPPSFIKALSSPILNMS